MTVELIQGLLLAFAIVVILMPPYIRLLRATGFTKQIQIESPDSHQVKHGTPTMGGVLVIAVVLALYLLFRWPPEGGIFAPLAALAGVGLLGAFDDYLNAKTGEGIRVRQKLIWQVVFAFAAAFLIQRTYAIDQIAVPFIAPVFVHPTVYVFFAAFAIVAASNGVNITDGLDGLAGVGLLGAFDDYLNAKTGEGIRVRQKLIWQVVFAFTAAFLIQRTYDIDQIAVPFYGPIFVDPVIYVIFGAFAIIAASNGVNITDGLDGLAGGTLVFAFVAFLLVAILNQPDAQPNLAFLCALIIGALLGFLWFNVHPAQIFMGDSGSLSLGATLAVIALITGQILVLPLIGLIFVIETGSDIIQIGYFKLSGGKRIFRMAPLNHHFELAGWDEEKITLRFWIVGILSGLLGVTLFLASIQRLE